jgi:hypothetical protein
MQRQTIPHSLDLAPPRPQRGVDLDWVRIGAFEEKC